MLGVGSSSSSPPLPLQQLPPPSRASSEATGVMEIPDGAIDDELPSLCALSPVMSPREAPSTAPPLSPMSLSLDLGLPSPSSTATTLPTDNSPLAPAPRNSHVGTDSPLTASQGNSTDAPPGPRGGRRTRGSSKRTTTSRARAEAPGHVTMPVPRDLTPAELHRRMRAREYVRKAYDRKKNTIASLREELAALELQHKTLVESKLAACNAEDSVSEQEENKSMQRYRELAGVKQQLYDENVELYRLNTERMILGGRLQQVIDMAGQPSITEMPYRVRLLTEDECAAVINESCEEGIRFASKQAHAMRSVEVCGWRAHRRVQGDMLSYAFEKTFSNITAAEFVERSWNHLSKPETQAQLLTSSMNCRVQLLQHVNPDTILFYWTISPLGTRIMERTLFVFSRIRIPGGYLVTFKTLENGQQLFYESGENEIIDEARSRLGEEREREVRWVRLNSWAIFRDVGHNSCLYHFGGSSKVQLWRVETLLIAMRWEYIVLGSHLLQGLELQGADAENLLVEDIEV